MCVESTKQLLSNNNTNNNTHYITLPISPTRLYVYLMVGLRCVASSRPPYSSVNNIMFVSLASDSLLYQEALPALFMAGHFSQI